jgi:tetratricopeptide (TPR) repeat protein
LDQALLCEPDYPQVLVERSVLRMQTGDLAGARGDLDEILRLVPEYELAFYLRGILRAEQGEKGPAAEDFRAALKFAPANWPSREDAERRLRALTAHEESAPAKDMPANKSQRRESNP